MKRGLWGGTQELGSDDICLKGSKDSLGSYSNLRRRSLRGEAGNEQEAQLCLIGI